MVRIEKVQELAEALQQKKSVYLTCSGQWGVKSGWLAGLQQMTGLGSNRLVAVTQQFIKSLDALEAVPVRFGHDQTIDLAGYLAAAIALSDNLANHSSLRSQEIRLRLQERLIALQYRLEAVNGGVDAAEIDPAITQQLAQLATEWKQQSVATYGLTLSAGDMRRLEDASRYGLFAAQLIVDSTLRDTFFQWIIRDQVDPAVFIQYPALRDRLTAANLAPRIGRFGGDLARIQKVNDQGLVRKIVTLPFEGQEISILDEQRTVTLRGHYHITIKQALDIFANKLQRVGDLEFFGNGINNWNAHLLGWWDTEANKYHQMDVNGVAWWKGLPIMEQLTLDQVKARYGSHLDGQQWLLAVHATRTTRTLNPDASHAFIEMVVPMIEGNYAVYAMGKFATTYAGSLFDSLKLFTATLPATIAYPDENIFYSHREHAQRLFTLSAAEGINYMESIRKDILKARNGSLTYQIESENCAKWIQDKLEEHLGSERVGDMFRIAMLDTEPPGAAAGLFAMLRLLPNEWHSPVLSVLHYIIGAWRGVWIEENGRRVWVSITTTRFWQDKVCYLPAVIHYEREQAASLAAVTASEPVVHLQPDSIVQAY